MKHPTLIEKVREVMRLKHYRYRTERSRDCIFLSLEKNILSL
jgi:hypothetical protein